MFKSSEQRFAASSQRKSYSHADTGTSDTPNTVQQKLTLQCLQRMNEITNLGIFLANSWDATEFASLVAFTQKMPLPGFCKEAMSQENKTKVLSGGKQKFQYASDVSPRISATTAARKL